MIVEWAGFICPPFQCLQAIPAWAVKACPPLYDHLVDQYLAVCREVV